MKITLKTKPSDESGERLNAAPLTDEATANRETYLEQAVELIRPWFRDRAKAEIPAVRVACGFPGGRGGKKVLGTCWDARAADDKVSNIFISPLIDEPELVLHVLVHELVHACLGHEEGHGEGFRKMAKNLDMRGKMTATYSGPDLANFLNVFVIGVIGKYPHAKLNLLDAPVKKQGTRMVKCYCKKSGYTVRTTRQWLDKYGAPISPVDQQRMEVEWPDEDADTVIEEAPTTTATTPVTTV